MTDYYNENDQFAADWLLNLATTGEIPPGKIHIRSIKHVTADDVAGYRQCHFFAGIGGWPLALKLAGWPEAEEVWTGSCPCQPFSDSGKHKGTKDERHLWPDFRRLIAECRPPTIFGEQVASEAGRTWLTGVRADLEALGYAVGAADLCVAGAGSPHIRQRLFWVAHGNGSGLAGLSVESARQEFQTAERSGCAVRLGDSNASQLGDGRPVEREQRSPMPTARSGTVGVALPDGAELRGVSSTGQQPCAEQDDGIGGLVHAEGNGRHEGRSQSDGRDVGATGDVERLEFATDSERRQHIGDATRGQRQAALEPGNGNPWDDFIVIECRDGKARRISAQPGDEPLANGIPRDVGRRFPEVRKLAPGARNNRVGRLRGYGNAIVPEVAAEFIRAFLESTR